MGQRAELPEPISALVITERLRERAAGIPDHVREKIALQDLAQAMAEQPSEILPRLTALAMDMCDAAAAGVSVLDAENGIFRWVGLAGSLAVFEGATTPRSFSPCGICLDLCEPVLMAHPERVYDWIRDAGIKVPEVLLVPLFFAASAPLGTLWVVAREPQHFHSGHARAMSELATFAGLAVNMSQTRDTLAKALAEQELLTREMSHRVKNFFAVAEGLIRTSARHAASKEELVDTLSGRLHALADAHALARRAIGPAIEREGVSLGAIVRRVLSPYGAAAALDGPDILLGEKATTNFALVFHELATNAFKHGALTRAGGSLSVDWQENDGQLRIRWREDGGPAVSPPASQGFGSTLIGAAVKGQGGTIAYDWHADGLKVLVSAPLDRLSQ